MKKIVVSWTGTVTAILTGDLLFEELAGASFFFSCQRHHVIRDDGLLPYEVTWRNKDRPGVYDRYGVELDTIDDDKQQRVLDLIKILHEADADGRVTWGLGSQPTFIQSLPKEEDVLVFYNKAWQPTTNFEESV